MTSDGTNAYSWDAENRLIQITYPGRGITRNGHMTDSVGESRKLRQEVAL